MFGEYVPFLIMGMTSIISSLVVTTLPETSNAPMAETLNTNNAVRDLAITDGTDKKTVAVEQCDD